MSSLYSPALTAVCHTGWRRLIGSPKLQIIFHKRATKYRSLLLKMTYKDKGSYASSPPYSADAIGANSQTPAAKSTRYIVQRWPLRISQRDLKDNLESSLCIDDAPSGAPMVITQFSGGYRGNGLAKSADASSLAIASGTTTAPHAIMG